MAGHFDELRDSGLFGGLTLMGASAVVMLFVGTLGGSWLGRWAVLVVLLVGFLVGSLLHRAILRTSGSAARRLLALDGETTPYRPTFSDIETLEVRGDLAGAEAAWAEALLRHPGNGYVLMRAAEFQLRLKRDPVAALRHFEAIRALPQTGRELGRYAAQKIVDLHLGPLADDGKAMAALRRLIDAFPDSREAAEAREALARLKAARARLD
jgi:hypothetical protein